MMLETRLNREKSSEKALLTDFLVSKSLLSQTTWISFTKLWKKAFKNKENHNSLSNFQTSTPFQKKITKAKQRMEKDQEKGNSKCQVNTYTMETFWKTSFSEKARKFFSMGLSLKVFS